MQGLLEENRGLRIEREDLLKFLPPRGEGGGKALHHEHNPTIIIEALETGRVGDPLEELSEEESDSLFIRALREKMIGQKCLSVGERSSINWGVPDWLSDDVDCEGFWLSRLLRKKIALPRFYYEWNDGIHRRNYIG
jgi:hypothetical protein